MCTCNQNSFMRYPSLFYVRARSAHLLDYGPLFSNGISLSVLPGQRCESHHFPWPKENTLIIYWGMFLYVQTFSGCVWCLLTSFTELGAGHTCLIGGNTSKYKLKTSHGWILCLSILTDEKNNRLYYTRSIPKYIHPLLTHARGQHITWPTLRVDRSYNYSDDVICHSVLLQKLGHG